MSGRKLWVVRAAVLAVSASFIALGLTRGEHLEVLQKAAAVCLECIGLG